MKRYEATKLLKKVLTVTGIVAAICGVVVGLVYLIHFDRVNTEQALCAPDQMDHSFISDSHTRAVCFKNGKLYLSEKIK